MWLIFNVSITKPTQILYFNIRKNNCRENKNVNSTKVQDHE